MRGRDEASSSSIATRRHARIPEHTERNDSSGESKASSLDTQCPPGQSMADDHRSRLCRSRTCARLLAYAALILLVTCHTSTRAAIAFWSLESLDRTPVSRVPRAEQGARRSCTRCLCFTSVYVPATLQRWTVVDDAMGTLQCCGFMQTESSKSIEEHTFSPLLFCATGQRSFRLCTAWCTDIFQKHFELRRLRGLR